MKQGADLMVKPLVTSATNRTPLSLDSGEGSYVLVLDFNVYAGNIQ